MTGDHRAPELFSWEDSLPYLLWRTQNALHRHIQETIDDLGVTVTQLGLAVHLTTLGPMSASELSRGFRITPQSVATALTRLSTIGWVERRPHPVHRRVVLYSVSAVGLVGVREGSVRMAGITGAVTAELSDQDTATLTQELRLMLRSLESGERPLQQLKPAGSR